MVDFKKYNWIDVKEYAKMMFSNYRYSLELAEDMWNIVMFEKEVPIKNIASGNLTLYEKGDMIIWLLSIFDYIFDFLCVIGEEEQYFDHDVGISDYATYNLKNLCKVIEDSFPEEVIENVYSILSKCLENEAYELINEKMAKQEVPISPFYDIENSRLNFDYTDMIYSSCDCEFEMKKVIPIGYEVLENKIIERRSKIVEMIISYFKIEPKIMEFFAGYHYVEHYTDYNTRKKELLEKQEGEIQLTLQGVENLWHIDEETGRPFRCTTGEEEKIIENYRDEIDQLEWNYPIRITNLSERLNSIYYEDFAELGPLYDWIQNGMN